MKVPVPSVPQSSAKLENLPFSKRAGYGAEKEYRVIAWSAEPQAAALGFDIRLSWVKRIELNPWMPKPLAKSVKDTIRAIAGCNSIEFSQSTLVDNQQWRDAGDRVVGREPGGPEATLPLKSGPGKSGSDGKSGQGKSGPEKPKIRGHDTHPASLWGKFWGQGEFRAGTPWTGLHP